jgi:hypothetical protein
MRNTTRKKIIRKQVSRLERVISVALVVGLCGIGAAIAIKGRHYDPHRFALDPTALAATGAATQPMESAAAPVAGPGETNATPVSEQAAGADGVPVAQSESPSTDAGSVTTLVAAAAAGANEELTPPLPELKPLAATEHYDPDSLYKKIDGQAEGYLGYQFKHLRCRSFGLAGGAYLDVYEYDMGEPLNAYGIYALERDAKAASIDFAPDGYRSALGFFFRQGHFYVQVLASEEKPELLTAAEEAARAVAKRLPADDTGLAARKLLPAEGMDPKTLTFVLSDGFGVPGLNQVFQAEYAVQDKKMTFFVAQQSDAARAEKVFAEFKKVSVQFGKVSEERSIGAAQTFVAESFGQWKVIYRRGAEIGGVVDTDQLALARTFVEQQLKSAGAEQKQ